MPSISAEVVLPSGVLQSSGYQYPLPHGGVGEHQSRIIPSQLVQRGMTFYDSILLLDEGPCELL